MNSTSKRTKIHPIDIHVGHRLRERRLKVKGCFKKPVLLPASSDLPSDGFDDVLANATIEKQRCYCSGRSEGVFLKSDCRHTQEWP